MRRPAASFLVIALFIPSRALGQEPVVRAGVTVGAVRLTDVRTEQVLTGIVEYDPTDWFNVAVLPAGVRVAQTVNGLTHSRSGVADLPLTAALVYAIPIGWSPNVGTGVTVTLPTGNAACGLGNGVASVGVNAGIGITPVEPVRLSLNASHSLSGQVVQSAITAPHATWVSSEASVAVSSRWTLSLVFGGDVGSADSARPLGREWGGGISYAVNGPLAITLDGSHGLTRESPKWVLSLGVGTAFAGTSPVTPTAPVRRLQTTVAGGTTGIPSPTAPACR